VSNPRNRFGYLEFPRDADTPVTRVPREETGAGHLELAEELFSEGYWEPALREYSRAIRYDKGLIPAWVGQVRCLLEMEEVDEAFIWAQNALSWFPRSADLLAAKALVLSRQGNTREALACSDASFDGESEDPFRWLVRADILFAMGRRASAKNCVDRLVAEYPEDWKLLLSIGRIYLRHRLPAEALAYLDRAAHKNPSQAFVWYQMAKAYRMLHLPRKAKFCCEQALTLRPSFCEAQELALSSREVPCVVATACLTPADRAVLAGLRRWRDEAVCRCAAGRMLLAFYERTGPPVARICRHSAALRRIVRTLIVGCAFFFLERSADGDTRPYQGSH